MNSYTTNKQTSGKGGGVLRDTKSASLFDIILSPVNFWEQNQSRRYCARRADLRDKKQVHTALNLLHLQDPKMKHSPGILQPGFQR